MAKVQDTYNPVTGEYVKRISDYVELGGGLSWGMDSTGANFKIFAVSSALPNMAIAIIGGYANAKSFKYDTKEISSIESPSKGEDLFGCKLPEWSSGNAYARVPNYESGFGGAFVPTSAEAKAYFYGWRMCNSDSTSPYYKSEVPYTPATWAEWQANTGGGLQVIKDSTGISLTGNGTTCPTMYINTTVKPSTKYGYLYEVVSNTLTGRSYFGGSSEVVWGKLNTSVGNNKTVLTSSVSGGNSFILYCQTPTDIGTIKLKDIRVFELPTGSQIEADFNTLTADQLTAKYTFNGLCLKHWKKVTDGTGLTSTLPTASYTGYTPYKMIYQLATPEISYLTPKTTIPLYDTNTIVETDTPSDCKADVTVGYKLKDGVTAVAGDITAPTPDYMSAVNSVSEDGLGKGVVRSPNIVANGNFASGATGWGVSNMSFVSASNGVATFSEPIGNGYISQNINGIYTSGTKFYWKLMNGNSANLSYSTYEITEGGVQRVLQGAISSSVLTPFSGVYTTVGSGTSITLRKYYFSLYSQTIQVGGMQFINLTSTFGAGNEPTKAQCDILFATWQDKASTQATLPTLRKIGTVADTYNPETGVLIQRIGKKVFDGTEALFSGSTAYDGNNSTNRWYHPIDVLNASNAGICSHLKHYAVIWAVDTIDGGFTTNTGNQFHMRFPNSVIGVTTSDSTTSRTTKLKAYLAQQYANGTPVTVYYQLATPVITNLGTGLNLTSFNPTTIITSDSTVLPAITSKYELKVGETPVGGDIIVDPDCVNPILNAGNEVSIVTSTQAEGAIDANALPFDTFSNGSFKTKLTLSAPLRKVGTVADRLFRDTDGIWRIERKIGEKIFNGTEGFVTYTTTNANSNISLLNFSIGLLNIAKKLPGTNSTGYVNCSHFKELSGSYVSRSTENISGYVDNEADFVGAINVSRLTGTSSTALKAWFANQLSLGNPVIAHYRLVTNTFETLPLADQNKLNALPTFEGETYVYTIAPAKPDLAGEVRVFDI